jgi:hypothetical protein
MSAPLSNEDLAALNLVATLIRDDVPTEDDRSWSELQSKAAGLMEDPPSIATEDAVSWRWDELLDMVAMLRRGHVTYDEFVNFLVVRNFFFALERISPEPLRRDLVAVLEEIDRELVASTRKVDAPISPAFSFEGGWWWWRVPVLMPEGERSQYPQQPS